MKNKKKEKKEKQSENIQPPLLSTGGLITT